MPLESNFRIISYKYKDSLYLRLTGDFDGRSAQELINTLRKHDKDSGNIFIDTNGLKTIHSFDRDVFQKNLNDIKRQLKKLIIVGVSKDQIAPN